MGMIVTLGGGVGGSKFLKGLALATEEEIVAIVNTGDDIERHGLYISPDIDINIYALANVLHPQGWGFKDETYHCQGVLVKVYQEDGWFHLGDKDLATHLYRTFQMKQNKTLSEITLDMCRKWGLTVNIIPMSDDPVATYIETPSGRLHFQEYLIQRQMRDPVLGIYFEGAEKAVPAPGVLDALARADIILIGPSNPLVSIGPILAVPGIASAIRNSRAKVVAISPIVGGDVVKGPAARMMRDLGVEVSPRGVAHCYRNLLDAIVIDYRDAEYKDILENDHLKVLVTDTLMDREEKKRMLARQVLDFVRNAFQF
jgi:LPPG:FO 2-phospho-L-lactate transferase